MGICFGSSANPNKSRSKKLYVPPSIRSKYRFETVDPGQTAITQDAATDKYDYLLVFDTLNEENIDMEKAQKYWRGIVPGVDDVKTEALKHLEVVWNRINKPDQNWKSVVREAIIEQLTLRAGLQLHKITLSGYVFCRVRAPIKLLELQAKKEGYRLQFKGEVDPGSEQFWNVQDKSKPKEYLGDTPELEEDRRQYNKEEANKILGRLQRAGKISPMDMSVNQIKETRRVWSRRVHALERVSDQVSVWNRYPAYHPFVSETHLRYLFQMYPSVRGKTLFRSKDRLYLTKAIIDRFFDMGKLVENGCVEAFMALHDANRGESLTIDALEKRWATFWRASEFDVGSPLVTDEAYEEDVAVSWYLRPFSQPLGNIREYMGEKLALHFAWLGSYTYNMILPTVVGTMFAFYQYSTNWSESHPGINGFQIAFIIFLLYWCVSNKNQWSQQEVAISLKWGTRGFEAAEKDRPQFKGDPKKQFIRSVINNRRITHFPNEIRFQRQVCSMTFVTFAICILLSMVVFVYYLDFMFQNKGYTWGSTLCSVLSAIQINTLSFLYGMASRSLNEWENHRTETAYEDNLVFKTFFFEIFNNFAALTYTCFFKGNICAFIQVSICNACTKGDCIADLQQLLLTLYTTRYIMHVVAFIEPMIMDVLKFCIGHRKIEVKARVEGEGDGARNAAIDLHFIEEFYRDPDDGTYDNYADVVLQYGYIVLFSPACPIIFLLSLGDNLISIRKNAWKQCTVMRRPDVLLAEDVGMWTEIMDYLTALGIYYNVAIFVWSGKSLEGWSILNKLLFFFLASQILLMVRLVLETLLGGVPFWIKQLEARQQFIMKKHLEGADDIDDSTLEKEDIEVLPDEVDVDGKSLYDFRKGAKMTKSDFKFAEELERKRRRIQTDLLNVRNQLEEAYSTETFNAQTGMGETKDGIPLGLLKIVVLRWQYLLGDEDDNEKVEMVDEVLGLFVRSSVVYPDKDTEQGRLPDRADSSNSCTEILKPEKESDSEGLRVDFKKKTLGPYAAIRTIHADLKLELVLAALAGRPDSGGEVVATMTKPLTELADQRFHENEVFEMKHNPKPKFLKFTGENRTAEAEKSFLFLNLQLQYSKIVPMRERIVDLQGDLVRTEEYLSKLKCGQLSKQETDDLSAFLKPEQKSEENVEKVVP